MENYTKMTKWLFFIWLLIIPFGFLSAQNDEIHWISFEQLEDSMNIKPQKVFLSFYADWCSYCKKMDKVAYRDKLVISTLNKDYYAVKMHTETKDTIVFEGKKFFNEQLGKQRNPTHQIPLLLASRKGYPFSLPATIILDKKFRVVRREFQYITAKKMGRILK